MTNDRNPSTIVSTHVSTTPRSHVTTLTGSSNGNKNPTDTVAAVTVAIVAVIIVLTFIFVSRTLMKRRRARQGERMDQPVPSISTGIMGTPAVAYANAQRHQRIQWEPVTPASTATNQNTAQSTRDTDTNQYSLPAPGYTRELDSAL